MEPFSISASQVSVFVRRLEVLIVEVALADYMDCIKILAHKPTTVLQYWNSVIPFLKSRWKLQLFDHVHKRTLLRSSFDLRHQRFCPVVWTKNSGSTGLMKTLVELMMSFCALSVSVSFYDFCKQQVVWWFFAPENGLWPGILDAWRIVRSVLQRVQEQHDEQSPWEEAKGSNLWCISISCNDVNGIAKCTVTSELKRLQWLFA